LTKFTALGHAKALLFAVVLFSAPNSLSAQGAYRNSQLDYGAAIGRVTNIAAPSICAVNCPDVQQTEFSPEIPQVNACLWFAQFPEKEII